MIKLCQLIALICIVGGTCAWLPSFFSEAPNQAVIYTPLIGIVGVFSALPTRKNSLVLGNLLVMGSFFLMMMIGYLIESIG